MMVRCGVMWSCGVQWCVFGSVVLSEMCDTKVCLWVHLLLFLHQDQGDKVTVLATPDTAGTPFCRFEDVLLEGGRRATVLRENPAGRELPIGDPKEVGYGCLPQHMPHEGGEGPLQELNLESDLENHCYCLLLAIPGDLFNLSLLA